MTTKSKAQDKNKMSEIDDQILKYFDIKKRLGKGAYGVVWKAIDKKSNQVVAVKKIFDAFRNETDAQRTFREIMFLRAFRNHPNVVQLFSIHKAMNNLDIYLSFEFMESDLHNVIKRSNILKDVHKRYVMYQLFNAIKYIHSGNVIHRDLKPSNVLIDSKCRCKIADFGLARSVSNRQICDSNSSNNNEPAEPILTDYVATRWYRAPEILIASKRYTKGIDMWSLGCILGEMLRCKPLFPGSSTVDQIEKIVSALPDINEKDIAAVGAGFGSVLLNQQINANGTKLDELLVGAPEDAKLLVKSLLVLDPSKRLTAKQALCHKYIEKFRHTIPEAELNSDVLPPFRDDVQLTVPEYRSKLYEIMQSTDKTVNVNSKPSSMRKSRGEMKSPMKLENSVTVTQTPVSRQRSNSAVGGRTDYNDVNEKKEPLKIPDKRVSRNNSFRNSGRKIGGKSDGDVHRSHNGHDSNNNNNKSVHISDNPNKSEIHISSNATNAASSGRTATAPMAHSGTQNHRNTIVESKIQSSAKIKYCKISNMPLESRISIDGGAGSASTNKESDHHSHHHQQHNHNHLNRSCGNRAQFSVEKRHSLDGGYTHHSSLEVNNNGYNTSSSSSAKNNNFHGSFTNLNGLENTNNNSGCGKCVKSTRNEDGTKVPTLKSRNSSIKKGGGSNSRGGSGGGGNSSAGGGSAHDGGGLNGDTVAPKIESIINRLSTGKSSKIENFTTVTASNNDDSGSYYERRLKNLEEKINRHKMGIRALFSQNTKYKTGSSSTVGGGIEGKSKSQALFLSGNSSNTSSAEPNKPLKAKLIFSRNNSISSNNRDSSGDHHHQPGLHRSQIPMASGHIPLFKKVSGATGSDYRDICHRKGLGDLKKTQITT